MSENERHVRYMSGNERQDVDRSGNERKTGIGVVMTEIRVEMKDMTEI